MIAQRTTSLGSTSLAATDSSRGASYAKEALSVVATNIHILVIALLITGLDMGIVHTGTQSGHSQPAINLSTGPSQRPAPKPRPAPTTLHGQYGAGPPSSGLQALRPDSQPTGPLPIR